jgi:hypothetical protein
MVYRGSENKESKSNRNYFNNAANKSITMGLQSTVPGWNGFMEYSEMII